MIPFVIRAWDASKDAMRAAFAKKHPENYKEVVHVVIKIISGPLADEGLFMSPDNIQEIGDEDYSGTQLYVIGEPYSSSRWWTVKIDYGSCSVCDTLLSIRDDIDEAPRPDQVDDYMTLALHIVQGLREVG